MKKIAHFGAYDHDSYGDLLFPHIAEHLFPDFSIIHVSPTGLATEWVDAKPTISVQEAISRTDWDGVLIGSGDIIQRGGWSPPKWERHLDIPFSGLPSLWAGASFLAAKLDIPLVWNAPGVPTPFPENFAPTVRTALECADYISVRDSESREILMAYTPKVIEVVADCALAVGALWPRSEKRLHIAFGPSKIDLQSRPKDIQLAIGQLRRQYNLTIEDLVVLPLMNWEFNEETLQGAVTQSGIEAGIAQNCGSLEAIARLIGSSRGYVGNSLHGMITALAYGVPAVLVPPEHNRASHKYEGFLEAAGYDVAEHIAATWAEAPEKLFHQTQTGIPAIALERLASHQERIRTTLGSRTTRHSELWSRVAREAQSEGDRLSLLGLTPRGLCGIFREKMDLLTGDVVERDRQIALLSAHAVERDKHIDLLTDGVVERDRQIAGLMNELNAANRNRDKWQRIKTWKPFLALRSLAQRFARSRAKTPDKDRG
jgi:polysaccharide pyruvyl transferase WcaK-like protein